MKLLLPILFILFYTGAYASGQDSIIAYNENLLSKYANQIISLESTNKKDSINILFKELLKETLSQPNSFEYEFNKIDKISILKADDVKIYNWAIPLRNNEYKYEAIVQVKNKNKPTKVIELIDKSNTYTSNVENKLLTNKSWYGCLYYKIIHSKKMDNNYTLLGWDGNNNLSNKKIIEVLNIGSNSILRFGAPIFKQKNKVKKRVVFEYSEDVVMSLKYNEKLGKIIFDHLAPSHPSLKGVYEYYGPIVDQNDAYILKNGKWIFEKNTEITLEKNEKDKLYNSPTE